MTDPSDEQVTRDVEAATRALTSAVAAAGDEVGVTLSADLRLMELRSGDDAWASRVAFRLRHHGGLDGLSSVEIGLGIDGSSAVRAAVDGWIDVVLPAVRRALAMTARGDDTVAREADVELEQRVPGSETVHRWAVFLGPPQLRAHEDVLPALAANQRERGLFEVLVGAGALPHFPPEQEFHWARLWVGRPGGGRPPMARVSLDSQPWPRAHESLLTAADVLPDGDAASHVLVFAVLRRVDHGRG